jgi:hypothetical protein
MKQSEQPNEHERERERERKKGKKGKKFTTLTSRRKKKKLSKVSPSFYFASSFTVYTADEGDRLDERQTRKVLENAHSFYPSLNNEDINEVRIYFPIQNGCSFVAFAFTSLFMKNF